jgi:peptidoglycan/LPS O-acetylase OafA/YrhL
MPKFVADSPIFEAPLPAPGESGAISVRPDRRIPSLDGLRAVASLMVLCYHFGPHIVRDQSRFDVLHRLPQLTWAGVDLFFVLSGFLISGILLDSRQSPRYFKVFYARRVFRIFPLYYLLLFAYICALAIYGNRTAELGRLFENPLSPWTYSLYFQNFAMTAAGSFGPIWLAGTWSLAVEEQFYLTLPVMIRKLTPKLLAWCVLGAFLGAPLLRAAIQKFRFVDPMGGYVLLPSRIDSLAAGVLITMLLRYRYRWIAGEERTIRFAVMAFLFIWIAYEYIPNPQAIRLAFIVHTGNAVAFAGILLVVLLSPLAPLSRFLSTPVMRELGNMAYSTYLFHPILLCIVFHVIKGHDPLLKNGGDLPVIGLALISTLILSWLSWRFFEKPLIRRGHQYQY